MKKSVAVLGDGAWGTAFSTLLANNGYAVKLWCRDLEVAQNIKTSKINSRYLPEIVLSSLIEPITDLQEVVHDTEWIFHAIPVQFTRSVIQQLTPFIKKDQKFVMLSKGIEQNTLMFPSQIIDDVLGYEATKAICVGPTFAQELAQKQFSATTLSIKSDKYSDLQDILNNDYFKAYLSFDMIGAQVASALKNVIALAIGMLDGAGYGKNTQAFVLTRGLHEIQNIAAALGGNSETIYGLAGVGDLVLTATSNLSKNRQVGKRLGQGENLEHILEQTGFVPEGINTVKSMYQLMKRQSLDLSLCRGIYQIIFNQMPITEFLHHYSSTQS